MFLMRAVTKLLLLLSAFAYILQAGAISKTDVSRLAEVSDLIVVGQVTKITAGPVVTVFNPNNSVTGHQQTATLRIARRLKGQSSGSTLTFSYFEPDTATGYGWLQNNQFGVFFLEQLGDGVWTTADLHTYALPALTTAPQFNSGIDLVEAEEIQVLGSAQFSAQDRIVALNALGTYASTDLTTALKAAMSNGNRQLYWAATDALLLRGDSDVLSAVREALLSAPSSQDQIYLESVAFALRGESGNAQALPVLIELLSSANAQVRRGAAMAIGIAGGQVATSNLPILLDDPDFDVRYYAVLGLGQATDQPDETPFYETFQASEQEYLTYWRNQFPTTPTNCATNVTSKFTVERSEFRLDNATGRLVQTLKVARKEDVNGPLALVLDQLSANVTLYRSAGITVCASPAGNPFVLIPSDETPLNLEFVRSTKGAISYVPRILGTSANR